MVGFGNGKRGKELSLPDPRPAPVAPDSPEYYGTEHGQAYVKSDISTRVDMRKLEYDTSTNKISQIAHLMQSLTYGEMIELADEIKSVDPEAQVIKPENTLAGVLHNWSKGKPK